MKANVTTETTIGKVDHEIDVDARKSFGTHTLWRDDIKGWWWVVTVDYDMLGSPEIVATGGAKSEAEAKRRAEHFLGAAKALLGDA